MIDIGSDLRLADPAAYPDWYGFEHPAPERPGRGGLRPHRVRPRPRLHGATLIANPGCYPTATLLALTPFARAGLLTGEVIVDAKSGVSGAGRERGRDFLYTELEGGTKAYGIPRHRHTPEIAQGLAAAGRRWRWPDVRPAPHPAGPRDRLDLLPPLADDLDDDALRAILDDAYATSPSSTRWPRRRPRSSPSGSNHAFVFVARTGGTPGGRHRRHRQPRARAPRARRCRT